VDGKPRLAEACLKEDAMITAGIDAGLASVKIVILKDGNIVAKCEKPGGIRRAEIISGALDEAASMAGISTGQIKKTVATGAGKYDATFANAVVTEPIADAKAAVYYMPEATFVIDIGADQCRVIALDDDGKISGVAVNQKCGAGMGVLLQIIARRLEMTLDELSELHVDAAEGQCVNDGCIVFAELDVLELLNKGVERSVAAAAVLDAIAVRISMVLNEKKKPAKDTTVLIGGLARNTGIVSRLSVRSGIKFIVPEAPQFGGALGCALLAAE
jgi:predicted CoA-substrate-specific enzyme activase